ncbi:MAG: DNA/RNA helicase [Zunongwangia sp.]|nr:DNA/RNA helicase [Zunongwangia sp.]
MPPAPDDPRDGEVSGPAWRELFSRGGSRGSSGARLALFVDLRQRTRTGTWGPTRLEAATAESLMRRPGDVVVGLRPAVRGASEGSWIRGEVSWDALRRPGGPWDPVQARWFAELHSIAREVRSLATYSDLGEWLVLDTIESTLLWPHLAAADAVGVPLVGTSTRRTVSRAADAAVGLRIDRSDGDALRVSVDVDIDGERFEPHTVRPVGATGVYAYRTVHAGTGLVLAPVALDDVVRGLLRDGGTTLVPADDAGEFLHEHAPPLARRLPVHTGPGVQIPPAPPPSLRLRVDARERDRVVVEGEWSYPGSPPLPLAPPADGSDRDLTRDPDLEAAVLARVHAAWTKHTHQPWAARTVFRGVDAAEFTTRLLPELEDLAGVRVEIRGDARRHRELLGDPRIRITTVESSDPDWFDLGIQVTIDGRRIPFTGLFTALATRRTKMMLSDGAYFSLRHPALDRLRELIDEAVEMTEWESGPRIHRHQLALWTDFEDLADESDAAVSWRAAAQTLRDTAAVPEVVVPDEVRATLRPYQVQGVSWLTFLAEHRLGGILADDMGLGKTLQVLAALAVRSGNGAADPSLVVAPTSVLGTWVEEATRFVPDLRIAVVSGAGGLTDVGDVDIVITSYTVLRLDQEAFAAERWGWLVLDEAQFVKNPATRVHRAVAGIRAEVRFALSGTPLENSLTELHAILSLTSPGLFPSARRFRQEYVGPIERGKAPDDVEAGAYRAARLDRLRARVRPLLLRRTKSQVAEDLPPRQEQVLHVELSPSHRARYDTALQRERQKILGLLDDLDRHRFIVFRSLTLLRMLSLAPRLIDPEAPAHSHKLDLLVSQLAEVMAEGRRALVFSQFTSFLDLAEDALDAAGIGHVRLDGSTADRSRVVQQFRGGDAPVFLISLKAGGFGLNLTDADVVILLDPWWNPAAESQAIDRTHRIGQTRPVMVYRLIAAGTIEEKVRTLQQRKARLFGAVLDDDDLFARALEADDIRALLGD